MERIAPARRLPAARYMPAASPNGTAATAGDRRPRAHGAERVERHLAVVLAEEAEEALVVARRHVEELDQHAVVAALSAAAPPG